VAGAEFILEGLYALKKISRNEELGYRAEQSKPGRAEPSSEDLGGLGPRRRPIN